MNNTSPAYTMSGRIENKTTNLEIPGPGAYEYRGQLHSAPSFSFSGR